MLRHCRPFSLEEQTSEVVQLILGAVKKEQDKAEAQPRKPVASASASRLVDERVWEAAKRDEVQAATKLVVELAASSPLRAETLSSITDTLFAQNDKQKRSAADIASAADYVAKETAVIKLSVQMVEQSLREKPPSLEGILAATDLLEKMTRVAAEYVNPMLLGSQFFDTLMKLVQLFAQRDSQVLNHALSIGSRLVDSRSGAMTVGMNSLIMNNLLRIIVFHPSTSCDGKQNKCKQCMYKEKCLLTIMRMFLQSSTE